MSYEIYIDVRHHPRHNDEAERRLSDAVRLADDGGFLTRAFDSGDDGPIKVVAAGLLRAFADRLAVDDREQEAAVLAPIVLREIIRLLEDRQPLTALTTAQSFLRALERDGF